MNDVEIADRTCYYCHYRPVCVTRLFGGLHLFRRLVHVPDPVIFSAKIHPKWMISVKPTPGLNSVDNSRKKLVKQVFEKMTISRWATCELIGA